MHYEINVSKNGKHYFATHERSLRCTREEAQAVARHFQAVFPKSEGYEIALSECHNYSNQVEIAVPYDGYGRPIKCAGCGTINNVRPDLGSGGPYRCSSPDCVVF